MAQERFASSNQLPENNSLHVSIVFSADAERQLKKLKNRPNLRQKIIEYWGGLEITRDRRINRGVIAYGGGGRANGHYKNSCFKVMDKMRISGHPGAGNTIEIYDISHAD